MSEQDKREKDPALPPVQSEWGKEPEDHFGYASDKERLAKRGMEDWELVDRIPESQRGVPVWFIAVVVVVMLVAVGLSFPFWGDRPGFERSWFNWGFVAALVYVVVAGTVVYFMVNLYGSHAGGRLDSDKQKEQAENDGEDAGSRRKGDD